MLEKQIDINKVAEIRTKTTLYFGVGAINKMEFIAGELAKRGLDKVLIMTGKLSYKKTGAFDVVEKYLKENNIEYLLYDKVTPNPEHTSVDEAVKLGRGFGVKAVIGIGGGSAIDASKAAAIMLEYPENTCAELFENDLKPEKAVPVIAINLTHGTGTEVDRYSVISIPEKQKKSGIGYEFIYPLYAIDDPALMVTLPEFQTIAVTLDALNHVFEASTSTVAHIFTLLCAKETARLIHTYLPKIIEDPKDIEARYHLAYASMIAGVSFDNGRLHLTHALEHPLSAVNTKFTHGFGLSILLPAVVEKIFDAKKDVILDVFSPIFEDKKDMTAKEAGDMMKQWLKTVGVDSTLTKEGFTKDQIDLLTDHVSLKGLSYSSPVEPTRELVKEIYEMSF